MKSRKQVSHWLTQTLPVVEEAGTVLQKFFRKNFEIREKEEAGLVTSADLASEAILLDHFQKLTPHFGILSEEAGSKKSLNPNSEGRWIIDPLDGTTNFAHGFPMFCITLALELEKQVVLGLTYHPIFKEWYTAIRGEGARLNHKHLLRVSRRAQLREALLTTGFNYDRTTVKKEVERLSKVLANARAVRREGSAALDLAYVARGVFDGFWEEGLSPWDVAAGALLIEEAGGKVTRFDGSPFSLDAEEILAANLPLHPHLQRAIR